MAQFVLNLPERNDRKQNIYKQMADIKKCEYVMIHTSFINNKGCCFYKIWMSTYFIVIVCTSITLETYRPS